MKDRTIETERLRLEPFVEHHLTDRYVSWLADPEVVCWSENRHRKHTLESCRKYWQSFRGTPNMLFALVAKAPELGHVGNLNVYVDVRHGVADIGIMLGERSTWGKGFGREAWNAALQELVRTPGIRKVTGGCIADNQAMVRIMVSCGMSEDGRRTRHYVYDGRAVDLVYYASFVPEPRAQ